MRSEAPQKGNGEVKVKIATQTEHTLAFDCTPTGDVKEYLVSMLDETEYETVKRWVGKDGLQAAILTGIVPVIAQETEASSFSIPGLERKQNIICLLQVFVMKKVLFRPIQRWRLARLNLPNHCL